MDSTYKLLVVPKEEPIHLYYRPHQDDPERSIIVCSLKKQYSTKRVKKWFACCGDVKKVD
jgi:hypothetical protein